MIEYAINMLALLPGGYFAMRWIRAEKLYVFGVPVVACLIYTAAVIYLPWRWLLPVLPYLALAMAVELPVLFEEKYRKNFADGFFFAFATTAMAKVLLSFMEYTAAPFMGYEAPFREFFAVIAYGFWLALVFFLGRFFPKTNWLHREELTKEDMAKVYPLLFTWCLALVSAAMAARAEIYLTIVALFAYLAGLLLLCFYLLKENQDEQVQQLQESLDNLREYMYTIRTQRHDYNFHVHTIRGLLENQKYQECLDYMEDMVSESVEMNELMQIKDPAVSAEIYAFSVLAASKGIRLQVEVLTDFSKISTTPYETNKVIGNMLQNALDECEKLSDLSYGIHLTIYKKGEYCLIRVSNKLSEESRQQEIVRGKSSKGGNHEGIGVVSISLLVSKYKGVVYHTVAEDIFTCIAKIPFRVL